jgi:methyl-accepting chemotaxis protein
VIQDITELESSIQKMNEIMKNVKLVSEQVSTGARHISESSQDLANGASQQASAIEQLNANIDMVNEKTQTNAKNAYSASDLAKTAREEALIGNNEMQQMLQSMNGIKDASSNISRIIKTIEDIAFQTNLLALNAAVEAARAGEHGKGFAVVAEEVRNLAARSQLAAKETTDLITDAINRVDEGTGIAQSTANALNTIVSNFDEVSKIVEEIAADSSEQTTSIEQISIGITQITGITQSNSSVSEQTAAASQELAGQSETLVNLFKDI